MPTYTATMNHLNKPFIKTLSSQSTINHILTRVFVLQKSQLYSTSPKEPELVSKSRDWPRPITIPWQSKVANLVNLVGSVSRPIKFQESDDGKFWAGTTISQEEADHSTAIEIPIIFEGHLAQTAACHLKERDLIHIAGHFSEDPPQISLQCGHCIGQISFIEETSQAKERYYSHLKQVLDNFWRDLCGNPNQWTDYRKDKLNGLVKPKHPDFKRKDSGQPLWLNTAPKWAISELPTTSELPIISEEVPWHKYYVLSGNISKTTADKNTGLQCRCVFAWLILVCPLEDSSLGNAQKRPEGSSWRKESEEASWKNLTQNPDKWWDVRSDKLFNHDFEHKDTGKALWLSSSPDWVFEKLPPPKPL
ncbi:protein OSB2, chloroplastic-like isoform X2 [Papaver somniferum]|uniref:protein OSB2, chloroplastic-like isoform X2 n=1 Tax=Papaver somniferum TaxID=3469 RepID=UPI000E705B8F|nr:protein OSB2, chloroplastic-like isoform X2 [Papaver somniferum]